MWQEPGLPSLDLTKREDICHIIKQQQDHSLPVLLYRPRFMDLSAKTAQICGGLNSFFRQIVSSFFCDDTQLQ